MKYVKLTVKPGTWYKAGTEVYNYDCWIDTKCRLTLEEWEKWIDDQKGVIVEGILVRGWRVSEGEAGVPVGEEYFDGEFCSVDEFEVEIVEESV
jgi:hypothetical protein